MKDKVMRLMELVLELNEKTDSDYFMNFAGHCEVVDVYVYRGGWDKCLKEGKNSEYILFCAYLDNEYAEEWLDDAIAKLEKELER